MSDAFNVAARVPMSRASFDRWLEEKTASPAEIDFSPMYRGWYWEESSVAEPPKTAEETSVKRALASRLEELETTLTLVVHEEGHLWLFDMILIGPDHARAQRSMSLLAQTSSALEGDAKGYFVYWADISGRLPKKDGVLSFGELSAKGLRFLGPAELTKPRGALKKTLAFLAPVEARFGEMVAEALGSGSYPKAEVLRSAKYVDPAVLT
jgi:hypothetical protein